MKNKIFPRLIVLGIVVLLSSCASTNKTSGTDKGKSESKESFTEFSYAEHVKKLKLSSSSISMIQVYASKAFQLTATSYSQSVLVEEGVLVLERASLGTIIKFKDKIKGKVVNGENSSLLIQFHDGSDGKIGPPILFSAVGNGLYRITTKNGVIPYQGVNYTPSDLDVVLMIKYKERTSTGQDSFAASGLEVIGSSSNQAAPAQQNEYPVQQNSGGDNQYNQQPNPADQGGNQTPPKSTDQNPFKSVTPKAPR